MLCVKMRYGHVLSRHRLVRLFRPFLVEPASTAGFATTAKCSDVRVRFAPSPTGFLHIGGLRTALLNYLFAKSKGGKFIIRIEDTDQSRVVPGAVENLLSQLRWAGIDPDEGPSVGGDCGPYVQSERTHLYQRYANQLLENGSAYRCFCSHRRIDVLRRDQIRRKEHTRYDNRCRDLSASEIREKLNADTPFVLRLRLRQGGNHFDDLLNGRIEHEVATIEGDPVIQKSDRYPTYHLANVVDDHLMKITHVLRGKEWMISTCKHVMLYDAFGWKPPQYAHLPLFNNEDGKKLSKRQGDIFVEHYREKGYIPAALLNFMAHYGAGFSKDVGPFYGDSLATPESCIAEMAKHFELSKVGIQDSVIRLDRLDEYNSAVLRHLMNSNEGRQHLISTLHDLVSQTYGNDSLLKKLGDKEQKMKYLERVLSLRQTHIALLHELVGDEYSYVWTRPVVQSGGFEDEYATLIQDTCGLLKSQVSEHMTNKEITALLRNLFKSAGVKTAPAMATLRNLLIGRTQGPAVAELIRILGCDEARLRLSRTHGKPSTESAACQTPALRTGG